MPRSRWLRGLGFAAPGLLLAGFGLVHPGRFAATTADWWEALHVILLPVFPLLAAAQWMLLAPAPPVLRLVGRLAAFGFAAYYTGLDAVAGIAAGALGVRPGVGGVFAIGEALGYVGAGCFLAANVCLVAAIGPHAGWRVAPGAVLLLAASMSFIDSHIFWPRGVFTMVAVAVGMYLLSVVGPGPAPCRGLGDHVLVRGSRAGEMAGR